MSAVRRTPHIRCARCASRRTRESRLANAVAPGLVARDAECGECGAAWRNLRGSIMPIFVERRKWRTTRA